MAKRIGNFLEAKKNVHILCSAPQSTLAISKSWFLLKYIKEEQKKENSGMSLAMRFTTATSVKEHSDGAVRGT